VIIILTRVSVKHGNSAFLFLCLTLLLDGKNVLWKISGPKRMKWEMKEQLTQYCRGV
jgi:hypothetical protein